MQQDTTVADNPAHNRYELSVGGKLAAIAQYAAHGNTRRLVHTEVFPGNEGKGLGSTLAAGVFADLRERGLQAQLRCEFMAGYAKKHPEVADLVVGG